MYRSYEYFLQNYSKGRLVGRGSYSRVYEVVESATNSKFALKEIEIDEDQLQRHSQSSNNDSWFFLSEKVSEICQIFMEPHPNLANIKFFFKRNVKNQIFFCIVMEFLPMTLEQQMKSLYSSGTTVLHLGHIIRLLYCILDGLMFLQSKHKIAHRDLKPANIMLTDDGKYKIIDLGICTPNFSSNFTKTRTLVGTPRYMAPELLEALLLEKNSLQYNPFKSDCFSLGVLIVDVCFVNKEEITGINLNNKEGREKKARALLFIESLYGKDFRSLVEAMLDYEPKRRPEYDDILAKLEKIEKDFYSRASKQELTSSTDATSTRLTEDGVTTLLLDKPAPLINNYKPSIFSREKKSFKIIFMTAVLELINYLNNFTVESLIVSVLQSQDADLTNMTETTNFVMWSTRLFFNIIFPIAGGVILMKSNSVMTLFLFYSLNFILNICLYFSTTQPVLMAIIKSFSCCLSTTICIGNTITILKYLTINRISLAFSIMYLGQLIVGIVGSFSFVKQIFDCHEIIENAWKISLLNVMVNLVAIILLVIVNFLFLKKDDDELQKGVEDIKESSDRSLCRRKQKHLYKHINNLEQMFSSQFFWVYALLVAIVLSIPNCIQTIFFSKADPMNSDNLIATGRDFVYQIFLGISTLLGLIMAIIADLHGNRFLMMLMSIPFTSFTAFLTLFDFDSWHYTFIPSSMNYAVSFVCVFAVLRQFIDREIIVTSCVIIWIIMNLMRSIVEFINVLSEQSKNESLDIRCFQVLGFSLPILGLILFIMKRRNNIGRGSFAHVYEAFEKETGKKFSLKEIALENDISEGSGETATGSWQFLSHKISEILQVFIECHPSIAIIHFFFQWVHDETVFFCIIMEYLPINLEQEMEIILSENQSSFSFPHIIKIFYDILDGLIFLEKNKIAHRDLKPANIMTSQEGNYKLIDLGISAPNIGNTVTKGRTLVGTPRFMAPELLKGFLLDQSSLTYNPFKSDCYSLGLIFLYLSIGNDPELKGINMESSETNGKRIKCLIILEKKFGTIFKSIIEAMIDPDPDKRPSYQEILEQMKPLGMQSVKSAVYTDRRLLQLGYKEYQKMIRENNINTVSEIYDLSSVPQPLQKKRRVMIFKMVSFLFSIEFLNYICLKNLENAGNALLIQQNLSIIDMGETRNFISWTVQILLIVLFPLVMWFFLTKLNPNKFFFCTFLLSFLTHGVIFISKSPLLLRILVDIFVYWNTTICLAVSILILKNVPGKGISTVYAMVYVSQMIGSIIYGLPIVWNLYKRNADTHIEWFMAFGMGLNLIALFITFLNRNTQLLSKNTNESSNPLTEPLLRLTNQTFYGDAAKIGSIKNLLTNRFFWLYAFFTVVIMNIFEALTNIFFSKTLTSCEKEITTGSRYYYILILTNVIIFAFIFSFLADKYGKRFYIVLLTMPLQLLSFIFSIVLDQNQKFYSFIPISINFAAGFSCLYPGVALFVNRNMIITAMVIVNLLQNCISSLNSFFEIISLASADDSLQLREFQVLTIIILIYSSVFYVIYRGRPLAVNS